MLKAATITILNQGAGVGPFNLYAVDADGIVIQTIKLNVPVASLTAGYSVYNLPSNTDSIKIVSNNTLCTVSTTNQTITLSVPPACDCITIERSTEGTTTYSYTDCDGDDSGPLTLEGPGAVQFCGSDAISTSDDTTISYGSACVGGACVNGTLVVENYTSNETNIVNITPSIFYSFNEPPTFPDSPVISFPVQTGDSVTAARIKYNLPITVTLTVVGEVESILQLFRNDVLMETKYVNNNKLSVVFNSLGTYTFNTTDELKLVLIDGIN